MIPHVIVLEPGLLIFYSGNFVVGPPRIVRRSFMPLVLWKVHALCWLALI